MLSSSAATTFCDIAAASHALFPPCDVGIDDAVFKGLVDAVDTLGTKGAAAALMVLVPLLLLALFRRFC